MKFSHLMLGSLAMFMANQAHADAKEFYALRAQKKAQLQKNLETEFLSPDFFTIPEQSPAPKIKAVESTYNQRIDHFKTGAVEDMRTFSQRYWVQEVFATGTDAPVILYICGEATCSGGEITSGPIITLASKLGAYVVALEHRYYGKSQPFDSLTTDNLKYLTVENAIEDLASFQKFIQKDRGLTGKWISIGGSYPGALSAFYRSLHPELVVGSLASSAPVAARENYEEYDLHVAEVSGPKCASIIRKAVKLVEDAMLPPSHLNEIKTAFAAEKITNDDDFLYLIADVGASAIQYGHRDDFCKSLIDADKDGTIIEAYGAFAQKMYEMWDVDAYGFSAESAENLDPNSYIAGFGQRQWMYQSCTQFGFFQNAYHDPAISVRSARINPQYHRNLCKRLFGIDQPVAEAQTNKTFLSVVLNSGSNILFTNGSQDPWSLLSILPGSAYASQNPNISLHLIDGAAHCSDLTARAKEPAAVTEAKILFNNLAAQWVANSTPKGLL